MAGRFLTLCGFLLLIVLSPAVRAAELAVILSDRGPASNEFLETLQGALENSSWQIRTVLSADAFLATDPSLRQVDLWLSVGSEATRAASSRPGPPLLATLVSQQVYERLLAEQRSVRQKPAFSAMILDQPLGRQLQLIRTLLPRKQRLALLASPESHVALTRLEGLAQMQGFEVLSEEVSDDLAVVPALSRLLARTDVLLALPDPLVFGRNNVRPVLLTSYRFQRPVVAFSSAFVTAGALAAVYSTPAQMAKQTAEILSAYAANRKPLPGAQSPRYFTVSVNRQVANSLALDLPDEAVIQRALEAGRQDP